jgi:hypothetical protein
MVFKNSFFFINFTWMLQLKYEEKKLKHKLIKTGYTVSARCRKIFAISRVSEESVTYVKCHDQN